MKADKHIYPSVHRGIVRAAMRLLDHSGHSSSAFYTVSDLETMVEEVGKPDIIGDRLQGRGLHYFCAAHPDGYPSPPNRAGIYPNGNGRYAPSPYTMFLSEYRMAVILCAAGKQEAAMKSLSRAAHMLGDICCPPHTCGLTYFSKYGAQHKAFELSAATLFWEETPVTEEDTAAHRWAERAEGALPVEQFRFSLIADDHLPQTETLSKRFEQLARESSAKMSVVIGTDEAAKESAITEQLCASIRYTAALFAVFAEQMQQMEYQDLREGCPYYLCTPDKQKILLEEPLFLQFEEDGSFALVTQDNRYLTASVLGGVRIMQQSNPKNARFRFGLEPSCFLYVDGDQNRLVGQHEGHLRLFDRRFLRVSETTLHLFCGISLTDSLPEESQGES